MQIKPVSTLLGSGETNPLVITFASRVEQFSVVVANGDDVRSHTVSDNLGDSINKSLPSAGALGAASFSAYRSLCSNPSCSAPTCGPDAEPTRDVSKVEDG